MQEAPWVASGESLQAKELVKLPLLVLLILHPSVAAVESAADGAASPSLSSPQLSKDSFQIARGTRLSDSGWLKLKLRDGSFGERP